MHNHTTDKPPSPEDFNTYIDHRYTCGIIFTNKGTIYPYVVENATEKFTNPEIYDIKKSITDLEKNKTIKMTTDEIYNMVYLGYNIRKKFSRS